MKARNLCAVLGIAAATALVVFLQGLVTTSDHQARAVAERLLEAVPIEASAQVARLTLDYRPDGRVMQGPPLRVTAATTAENLPSNTCKVTRSLFAQRQLAAPPVGSELVILSEKGVSRLKIAEVIDWDRPARGYPNLFVSGETAATIPVEWKAWQPKTVDELSPLFTSDEERNFDRAKALLIWAAALTALCLLVNTLFLMIEAERRQLAILRVLGMTRLGVVRRVLTHSLILAVLGDLLGIAVSRGALEIFVAINRSTYPMGVAVSSKLLVLTFVVVIVLALIASLFALKSALNVKPLEAASACPPRRKHLGMLISFACGFGAFVAVEVWGASLMSAFVPSKEWPDAIVSILPGGVSSFDIEKLRCHQAWGVKELAEVQPLQVKLDPPDGQHNALLLASDWFPFTAVPSNDTCVITKMMARAKKLKIGDELKLDCGRGLKMALPIVDIVDLNWHMVTSRALFRGLNRMPVYTDGPVFVSFDTLMACDARPQEMVKMTHLWLNYEEDFVSSLGAFEAGRVVEKAIADILLTGDNTIRLHSRDEIADGTFAHGDELIGAMAKIPFVFIAVLSIGFVAMLIASIEARKREFKVLRAVGATRMQLVRILVGEALKVALIGSIIGLLGGSLVGWLSTAATRAAMASWGLPAAFALPPLPIFLGFLGAIGFTLVVAIPTSICGIIRKYDLQ